MVFTTADRLRPQFHTRKKKGLRLGVYLLFLCSAGMVGLAFWQVKKTVDTPVSSFIGDAESGYEGENFGIFEEPHFISSKIYDEVRAGESLYGSLRRLRVPSKEAEIFVNSLSKKINLRQLPVGTVIVIESAPEKVFLDHFRISDSDQLFVRGLELYARHESGVAFSVKASLKEGESVELAKQEPEMFKEHGLFSGVIENSVYGSILNNNGDALLVNNFSDIFAWQIDFSREARAGDSYQMVVEKHVSGGRFVGFGRILAAEYISKKQALRAFYFESSDGRVSGFFDDNGRSLRNAFLKAPLKLASISSKFGMRFHPVQKRMKPHNGVDYPANRGTPFMAVAGGTVINAGYSRFNGNWVRIRHKNGYQTEYLHATKLAKGVHVGAHIKQGQVIGYVGKTGLALGYHLHFGMKKNDSYVDPTKQVFARSAGIPSPYLKEFKNNIAPMVIALNRKPKGADLARLENKSTHENDNPM
ncbi:MAG: M23 family metallopeptidase [Myxococcales bacterium]|nr:M23 family metallopeptidase [Myxococcales bacterium]USN49814.1 MAG: M23 family metallopeptidase [Myxococcales bacterium]